MNKIILYKNFPINDYNNQVYYNTSAARDAAFDTFKDVELTDMASNNKTEQTIRAPFNYYVGNQYNYGCIVENNKRYYFFVDNVEWSSNMKMCTLHYSYDYWQTYCYDITFKKSFVEREHVNDDTFGKHIIDEGFNVDEYLLYSASTSPVKDTKIVVTVSDVSLLRAKGTSHPIPVPQFVEINKNEIIPMSMIFDNYDDARTAIDIFTINDKIDAITGVYMVPDSYALHYIEGLIIDASESGKYPVATEIKLAGQYTGDRRMYNASVPRPTKFINRATNEEYEPVNSKCFIYPFTKCTVSNGNGAFKDLKFELSNNPDIITIAYTYSMIEGGVSFACPQEYNSYSGSGNLNLNVNEGVVGLSNQSLQWINNTYSAYLAANQYSIANAKNNAFNDTLMNVLSMGASSISSGASELASQDINNQINENKRLQGASISPTFKSKYSGLSSGASSASSGISVYYNYKKTMNDIKASLNEVSNNANTLHGTYNMQLTKALGFGDFIIETYCCNLDRIRSIDNFFSMFGYKVDVIKIPQYNSRRTWNYLKTSGVNIIGDIPQDALNIIKGMFDSGVTIWHDINKMYDYEEPNYIVN